MALARFPPRAPPFRARYISVRCGNVLVYRHGDLATTTHLQVDSEAPRPPLSRQATGKLSLSSQSSSAALMTHPTPGKPLCFSL